VERTASNLVPAQIVSMLVGATASIETLVLASASTEVFRLAPKNLKINSKKKLF
jgi:hypothetical protein